MWGITGLGSTVAQGFAAGQLRALIWGSLWLGCVALQGVGVGYYRALGGDYKAAQGLDVGHYRAWALGRSILLPAWGGTQPSCRSLAPKYGLFMQVSQRRVINQLSRTLSRKQAGAKKHAHVDVLKPSLFARVRLLALDHLHRVTDREGVADLEVLCPWTPARSALSLLPQPFRKL